MPPRFLLRPEENSTSNFTAIAGRGQPGIDLYSRPGCCIEVLESTSTGQSASLARAHTSPADRVAPTAGCGKHTGGFLTAS